jgi:hypothetical protein
VKRFALTVAVLAVGVGWLIWFNLPEPEPVYQGKTVSQWLEPATVSGGGTTYGGRLAPPAIKEMGSNAVPSLIRMLRCRDSGLRRKFAAWISKRKWLNSRIKLGPPADEMQRRGLAGVAMLGPIAESAIPDVVNLLTNQNSRSHWEALMMLQMIDWSPQTAVAALLEALRDPDPGLRSEAAMTLKRWTRAPETIPTLVSHIVDPDLNVRETVLRDLQWFSRRPKLAAPLENCLTSQDAAVREEVMSASFYQTNAPAVLLPSLGVRLHDENSFVRSMAAFHLGEIGAEAAPAVPALKELLTDPAADVREAATNALWEIMGAAFDPAAASAKPEITLNMPGTPVSQVIEVY